MKEPVLEVLLFAAENLIDLLYVVMVYSKLHSSLNKHLLYLSDNTVMREALKQIFWEKKIIILI